MSTYAKHEVAIDLLEKALKMHSDGNLISAIVLCGASQQIFRDICLSKNINPTINTLSEQGIQDRKSLHDFIVKTYNKLRNL
jgi:hypothetical protein